MKKFLFFICLFFCICPLVQAAFVEGLEDIPLADELVQSEGGFLNFGNEETRLIEVYFTSETTDFTSVATFYKTTLPQMGWKMVASRADKLSFDREGESLEINKESEKPFVVRLTVKSKN